MGHYTRNPAPDPSHARTAPCMDSPGDPLYFNVGVVGVLVSFTVVATYGNLGAKSATVTIMNRESLIDAHHKGQLALPVQRKPNLIEAQQER